jgi:hypothetical protein
MLDEHLVRGNSSIFNQTDKNSAHIKSQFQLESFACQDDDLLDDLFTTFSDTRPDNAFPLGHFIRQCPAEDLP